MQFIENAKDSAKSQGTIRPSVMTSPVYCTSCYCTKEYMMTYIYVWVFL